MFRGGGREVSRSVCGGGGDDSGVGGVGWGEE